MAETKFTPGPWEATAEEGSYKDGYGNAFDAAVWGPDGDGVAMVYGNLALDGDALATARLIAAAPEMFKALLALANRFSYIEHTQDGHLISAARAALDKAVAQ